MFDSGVPGNGVTWRELHAELQQRDREQRERDERHQVTLEEVRDALCELRSAWTELECHTHAEAIKSLSEQMTDVVHWRVIGKVVPTPTPRLFLWALGLCAAVLGWDWWDKISEQLSRLK